MSGRVATRRRLRTFGLAVGLTLLVPGATEHAEHRALARAERGGLPETRDPNEHALALAVPDGTAGNRSDGRRADDTLPTDAP